MCLPTDAWITAPEATREDREHEQDRTRAVNHGIERVEVLSGNVGLISLSGFPIGEGAPEAVAAVMRCVHETDALIVDVRENNGGHPEMVARFSSYLFGEEPVHLNDIYSREGDRIEHFWTLPDVPGVRYGPEKPVFVLTSNRTFSGAEDFSYSLQALKRAVIVGETTRGGAHTCRVVALVGRFRMLLPDGYAVNPITHTNWEETGVIPDVAVDAASALDVAYTLALNPC
jgi:C-terminal processing protease CtpA/Prc